MKERFKYYIPTGYDFEAKMSKNLHYLSSSKEKSYKKKENNSRSVSPSRSYMS